MKNKIMTIETEILFIDNCKLRKIIKINNCKERDQLPDEYLHDGSQAFYYLDKAQAIAIMPYGNIILEEAGIYREKYFQNQIQFIRACGTRLKIINKKKFIKKETFYI